jgi:hypothetical protein
LTSPPLPTHPNPLYLAAGCDVKDREMKHIPKTPGKYYIVAIKK